MKMLSLWITETTTNLEGKNMMSRKPTHPGEILFEDVIKPLDLTITEAAKDLGVTRKTLSELVNQKSSLSPETVSYTHLTLPTTPYV